MENPQPVTILKTFGKDHVSVFFSKDYMSTNGEIEIYG
jgi:hypothetical protein